jgi:hypothetical protein
VTRRRYDFGDAYRFDPLAEYLAVRSVAISQQKA